jgi:uncharacterized protein (DUF58 family)
LAALVGYAALAGGDRVSVRTFDDKNIRSELPVLRGRPAFSRLYRFLADLFVEENRSTDDGAELKEYSAVAPSDLSIPFGVSGALPRRSGVTWLLTDAMFEAGMRETLLTLTAAGQQVVLVHLLSPEELAPSMSGELKLVDSELGTGKEVAISEKLLREYRAFVAAFQEELRTKCGELGAAYVFVSTSNTMSEALHSLMTVPGALRQ